MKDAAIIQAEISLNRGNGYEEGEGRAAGAEEPRGEGWRGDACVAANRNTTYGSAGKSLAAPSS